MQICYTNHKKPWWTWEALRTVTTFPMVIADLQSSSQLPSSGVMLGENLPPSQQEEARDLLKEFLNVL